MTKRRDDSEPGFADLVGDVRRLTVDTVELRRPRRHAPVRPHGDDHDHADAGWSDPRTPHAGPDSAPSDYQRPGIQRSVVRRLRRGGFAIEDALDLHGCRREEARIALDRFLDGARRERVCCVRVVHGKGLRSQDFRAVLKPHVRHWLRQDPRVLAYTPAAERDGGDGATCVLLRARRD